MFFFIFCLLVRVRTVYSEMVTTKSIKEEDFILVKYMEGALVT